MEPFWLAHLHNDALSVPWGHPLRQTLLNAQGNVLFVDVDGPAGSDYEGHHFTLMFIIPANYPFWPPVIQLTRPAFHPFINARTLLYNPHFAWTLDQHIYSLVQRFENDLAHPNRQNTPYANKRRLYARSVDYFNEAFSGPLGGLGRETQLLGFRAWDKRVERYMALHDVSRREAIISLSETQWRLIEPTDRVTRHVDSHQLY